MHNKSQSPIKCIEDKQDNDESIDYLSKEDMINRYFKSIGKHSIDNVDASRSKTTLKSNYTSNKSRSDMFKNNKVRKIHETSV